MKKYSLFIALFFMLSANTFANDGALKKDTNNNVVKANGSVVLSFKGSITNNISKLHWITEDEHGMKSFTIERSVNNRDFYPIAIMPAMNENGQLFYEYPDKDISTLSTQIFSYRLKITDAEDKDSYSSVIILYPDSDKAAVAISRKNEKKN
jgi:hypothetical protein